MLQAQLRVIQARLNWPGSASDEPRRRCRRRSLIETRTAPDPDLAREPTKPLLGYASGHAVTVPMHAA